MGKCDFKGKLKNAWFAANKTVTATDMKVTAQATGSLVITTGTAPTTGTNTTTVKLSEDSTTPAILIPTTHTDKTSTDYGSGLLYNDTPERVSPTTGFAANSSNPLTLKPVTETSGYYKDYTVYIAANGGEMTGQDLIISTIGDATTDFTGATSIDFYYSASVTAPVVGEDTYIGTLNLAKKNPDGTTDKINITKEIITIPAAGQTGGSAITILMRVYVDGALPTATPTKAFVNNVDTIAASNFGVEFKAETHIN